MSTRSCAAIESVYLAQIVMLTCRCIGSAVRVLPLEQILGLEIGVTTRNFMTSYLFILPHSMITVHLPTGHGIAHGTKTRTTKS